MQLAKASRERLIFAPSLSFCPALFVSEALSLCNAHWVKASENRTWRNYWVKVAMHKSTKTFIGRGN